MEKTWEGKQPKPLQRWIHGLDQLKQHFTSAYDDYCSDSCWRPDWRAGWAYRNRRRICDSHIAYVFGFEQLRAQGTALLISVFPVWVISFLPYYKTRNFDFKVAVLMALGIVIGSYFGGTWAQHLPATVLRRLLGLVLVGLGVRFVFS